MKIFLYTDCHFSEYSSIVRSEGIMYSKRLENLIQTMNWLEAQADIEACDMIVCLGDFFDKPVLNDKEITAVKEIKWSALQHYFIVGNHESSVSDLRYSSTKLLESSNIHVISSPQLFEYDTFEIGMLPYILESDRKSLNEYFGKPTDKPRLIFSHNDIKHLQYGMFESKEGFEIADIENCRLFLNGHIHNGTKFCKNGFNLGNATGQNFSEDALKYDHNAYILNTDTYSISVIENPHAFNFYKLDIETEADLQVFENLKNNAVLSISCKDTLIDKTKEYLEKYKDKIIEKRLILRKEHTEATQNIEELRATNCVDKFIEFTLLRLGETDIVKQELDQILGD